MVFNHFFVRLCSICFGVCGITGVRLQCLSGFPDNHVYCWWSKSRTRCLMVGRGHPTIYSRSAFSSIQKYVCLLSHFLTNSSSFFCNLAYLSRFFTGKITLSNDTSRQVSNGHWHCIFFGHLVGWRYYIILPKLTSNAPKNSHSEKEGSFSTTIFQVLC